MRISSFAWEHFGLGLFTSEKIPFGDTTSPTFAKQIALFVQKRVEGLDLEPASPILLYELGSGSGLLSLRVLEFLQDNLPELYDRTTIVISDFSREAVASIEESPLLAKHTDHVEFKVLDATGYKLEQEPILIYHSYLLDSLPARHIRIDGEGVVKEIRVRTVLPADSKILDTTTFPPRIIGVEDIMEILGDDSQNRLQVLAPKIIDVIEEEFEVIPVQELPDISPEELQDILHQAEKVGPERHFNYIPCLGSHLMSALERSNTHTALLIRDFGLIDAKKEVPLDKMLQSYGLAACCFVFPEYTESTAGSLGLSFDLVSNPSAQYSMLIRRPLGPATQDLFGTVFTTTEREEIQNFFLDVDEALAKKQGAEVVDQLYQGLTIELQQDFETLNNLAAKLLLAEQYDEAIKYCDMALSYYSHVSGTIYRIRGRANLILGNLDEARRDLSSAIEISPNDELTHYWMAEVNRRLGDPDNYITALKKLLKYSKLTRPIEILNLIAIQEEGRGNNSEANMIRENVQQLAQEISTPDSEQKTPVAQFSIP